MKLVYTDEAIDDSKRLREFIAVYKPSVADRLPPNWLLKLNRFQILKKRARRLDWRRVPHCHTDSPQLN